MYKIPDDIRSTYESLTAPIVILTPVEEISEPILVSDGFLELHGMNRELFEKSFNGKLPGNLLEKVHPDDVAKLKYLTERFVREGAEYDVIFRARRSDGYHMIHAVGSRQALPDGTTVPLIVYLDMNEHEEVATQLSAKTQLFRKNDFFSDPLTGLPNINYLHKYGKDRVYDMRSREITPVVVYFDIDSMQSYNTQYGFEKGDELLKLVANILKEAFHDGLLARGADDHFILIGEHSDDSTLASTIKAANDRIISEAFGNTTGIHAGICVCRDGMSVMEALDRSRRANKILGEDLNVCYRFFNPVDDDQFLNERYIIENFREALDRQWIKIYYQGFVRLDSRKYYGFEALARWVDPVRGIIPPSDFIPALEKYHMTHDLDLYMIDQVCKEIKRRYDVGFTLLPVSVNFSRRDFDYIDVASELNRIIDEYNIGQYGIDKSYFVIEITERDMAMGSEAFYEQLARIRKNGYKLWIDDFGSGYSSLNVFSRFDVDLIKFDMELLRNLDGHGGANREIIKAMIGVSRKLGVHTLCEGMETKEQEIFLKEAGCELAQGYLSHKPEPLENMIYRKNIGIPVPECETVREREEYERIWTENE